MRRHLASTHHYFYDFDAAVIYAQALANYERKRYRVRCCWPGRLLRFEVVPTGIDIDDIYEQEAA